MNERSAHGVRGYLLRTTDGTLVFRIYTSADRRQFIDYDIRHCDLEVEIVDDYSSLYEGEDGSNYIDYPSRLTKGAKCTKDSSSPQTPTSS
jgi:hypothetical protein